MISKIYNSLAGNSENRRLVLISIGLIGGGWLLVSTWQPPIQTIEGLAWCLHQKKAVMVEMKGMCRECDEQKKDFGPYEKYLTIADCSTRARYCQQIGLSTYPVWQIPGKKALIGRQNLRDLAVYAECPIASNFPLQ